MIEYNKEKRIVIEKISEVSQFKEIRCFCCGYLLSTESENVKPCNKCQNCEEYIDACNLQNDQYFNVINN